MATEITLNSPSNISQFQLSGVQKIGIAISIIAAVGCLVVFAIGVATVGVHQGWWSAVPLNQVSEMHSVVMLGVGGGTLILGGSAVMLKIALTPSISFTAEPMPELTEIVELSGVYEANPYPAMADNFNQLAQITGREIRKYPQLNHQEQKKLSIWLERVIKQILKDSKDVMSIALARKVQSYVELAAVNHDFRTSFNGTLIQATESCGDRLKLSFLHINTNHLLALIDPLDLPRMAEFLRTQVMSLEILQRIAARQSRGDAVEDYLAYPIKLKNKLGLLLDIEEMDHYQSSSINCIHLNLAAWEVKSKTNNYSLVVEFLIHNDAWVNALQIRFPREFREFQEKKDDYEGEDFQSLADERKAMLIEMTENVIPKKSLLERLLII